MIKFRIFGLITICILLFSTSVFALHNPEEKVTKVIEDYIIASNPDLSGMEIRVTYKFADKIFEILRGYEDDVTFKIVNVYKDFRPVGNVIFPIKVSREDVNRKIFIQTPIYRSSEQTC